MKVINKPIEMIAFTNCDGGIQPLMIRVLGKDKKKHTYDVLKITRTEKEKLAGNIMLRFFCQLDIDGNTRDCLIKFEKDTTRWTLFKI
ncbi:hypothetical protein [Vallitalea okinawensis]|uniref:hypothetical protein n=1 Tax=Vallitalea okinawensis TaxID=2078660 RepID=UPI000CFCC85E|nr:hypothetical protein [Vallitalea okinawensis]